MDHTITQTADRTEVRTFVRPLARVRRCLHCAAWRGLMLAMIGVGLWWLVSAWAVMLGGLWSILSDFVGAF